MENKYLHLFEGYGVELEYMIVDKDTLSILPVTDKIIHSVMNEFVSDAPMGEIEWSNELVLHVIELKTNGPAKKLDHLPDLFHKNILHINKILEDFNGKLMPGGMHPWMNPMNEMHRWPHDFNEVYEAYDKIFDCRGHGWSNLQSQHLNLPFANDEEFGKLHAALRLILPIVPGLTASSPIADSEKKNILDYRLHVYRSNQSRIPSISGVVIPEAVFTQKEYVDKIFAPLFNDISIYDQQGILQHEWLNSRGAIARFERNTIEIRLLDVQECPDADIAITTLIVELAKALIDERWTGIDFQKQFHEEDLSKILLQNIDTAENTLITNREYLKVFGLDQEKISMSDLWKHLYNHLMPNDTRWNHVFKILLNEGTLATRILKRIGDDVSPASLKNIYNELCECLAENKMFIP